VNQENLHKLAIAAGLEVSWRDVSGKEHVVSDESLSAVLKAIGLDAETQSQIDESLQLVTVELSNSAPKMLTAVLGDPIDAGGLRGKYLIRFESGGQRHGFIDDDGALPAIEKTGYHRLEINGAEIMLAAVLMKARFWDRHAGASLLDRQRLVLNRLLGDFEGKLTSSKYAKLAKCSQDTASRDIDNLIARGILVKDPGGGRSTSYSLAPIGG